MSAGAVLETCAFGLACAALSGAISVLDLGAALRQGLRRRPWAALLVATPAITGRLAGPGLALVGLGPTGSVVVATLSGAGASRLLHLVAMPTWTARDRSS
ncbi:MAG: hypothetical protein D6798_20870 [Deltaproteobacteria bacterium]|nr:MAG: hypothetical protein D6798_20870 [Deltaproteobacteria bacterium]